MDGGRHFSSNQASILRAGSRGNGEVCPVVDRGSLQLLLPRAVRIGALSAHNYSALTQADAEASFGSWIADFGGPGTVDAEPIIEREIRPLLEGSELFILNGDYDGYEEQGASDDPTDARAHHEMYGQIASDEHPTLDPLSHILMSWVEVVAISELTRTLTMVITSAD